MTCVLSADILKLSIVNGAKVLGHTLVYYYSFRMVGRPIYSSYFKKVNSVYQSGMFVTMLLLMHRA